MDLGPGVERGKSSVLGGALVATYVIFAAASMRVALRAREVQLPNLTNRTANEASAIAADLGLTLKVDDTRRMDPKIAAGRVLAQEPAAGSTARRQRTLRSAERRSARVVIRCRRRNRAQAQLRLAGRMTWGTSRNPFESFAPDVIVAQSRRPEARDRGGAARHRGERGTSYVMPDLIASRRPRRRHPGERGLPRRRRRIDAATRRGARRHSQSRSRRTIAPGEPISLE